MATGGAPKKKNFFKRLSMQIMGSPVDITSAPAVPAAALPPNLPVGAAPMTAHKKGSVIKRLSMHLLGGQAEAAENKGTEAELDALLEVQLATPWVHKLTGFLGPANPPLPTSEGANRKGSIIENNEPKLARTDSMVEMDSKRTAKSPAKP